jgi:hypothetical protein
MDGSRKRKIETRGAEAAEEEQRKKLQLKLGKVHCNYCKRDVSDQMYIKSAVPDPPRPAPPRPALIALEPAGCLPAGPALPGQGKSLQCTSYSCVPEVTARAHAGVGRCGSVPSMLLSGDGDQRREQDGRRTPAPQ